MQTLKDSNSVEAPSVQPFSKFEEREASLRVCLILVSALRDEGGGAREEQKELKWSSGLRSPLDV